MKLSASTPNAPDAPFLSQAVISNDTIYVSGQIHGKPDGSLVEGSVAEKLDQIMQNIAEILSAADGPAVRYIPSANHNRSYAGREKLIATTPSSASWAAV